MSAQVTAVDGTAVIPGGEPGGFRVTRDDGPYSRFAHVPRCNARCHDGAHWLNLGDRCLPRAEAAARALADENPGGRMSAQIIAALRKRAVTLGQEAAEHASNGHDLLATIRYALANEFTALADEAEGHGALEPDKRAGDVP